MANYKRVKIKGATYFFTLVLNERKHTALLIDNFDLLKTTIHKVKEKYPFDLVAMVVLPEHMHLIMALPENDDNYSTRIRLIKTYFSKEINTINLQSTSMKNKGEKGIWQRRFWEHVIRDEEDLSRHIDYIHFNPIKHGYCQNAYNWPYSTFHNYVKRGLYPKNWVYMKPPNKWQVGE